LKVVCSRCGRKFDSSAGLKQHLRAKHRGAYFFRYILPYLLIGVILLAGVSYSLPYLTQPRQTGVLTPDKEKLLNTWLSGGENLAMHIHSKLRIFVDGVEVRVPANIGIAPDGKMRVIHTHDETGVIHIESPIYTEFTLGDFMRVWGKRLDDSCFDTYCGTVRVMVNGAEIQDPLSHPFRDGDEITIEVTRY